MGEPGIGKTSLCEQLATYVALRGGTTLVGHCYEEGSVSLPYLAFVEAVRSYVLSQEVEDLKTVLGSGAGEVARIVLDVRERLKVEPSPPGDPEEDRYRLMQAVAAFLRNAAAARPLLLVLEDLHNADRGTLDVLTHVAHNVSGARLLIVGTYRDVEVHRGHPLSGTLAELGRISSVSRIVLRGLTSEEVQQMMSSIAAEEVPWGLAEAVYRQTEGNPLFVQEVLRFLIEEGLFARAEGRASAIESMYTSIPEGLRDVIGRRLSRLSAECNRVLRIAAVIGQEFRLDVLERVAGVPEDSLFAALEEARDVAVVEENSSVGGVVSFRFTHAFFRQTLYEESIAPRRIKLHQQVGRAIEAVHAGRLEERATELAEHFSNSSDADDLPKSLRYAEVAARRATAVYAHAEAARLLDQALQVHEVLDPGDRGKRCDLLLALGEALLPAGEPRRAFETVAPEALALGEALGDGERASMACQMALTGMMRYGSGTMLATPEYRQWAQRADGYAAPGTRERVHADRALSAVRYGEERRKESRELAQRALKEARQLEDPETLFFAALGILGRPQAPQHHEEQLRLATGVLRAVPQRRERQDPGGGAASVRVCPPRAGKAGPCRGAVAKPGRARVTHSGRRTGPAVSKQRASSRDAGWSPRGCPGERNGPLRQGQRDRLAGAWAPVRRRGHLPPPALFGQGRGGYGGLDPGVRHGRRAAGLGGVTAKGALHRPSGPTCGGPGRAERAARGAKQWAGSG